MFLNYVLLRGINDSREDARWLARVDRHAFLVKIAALNETAGTPSDLVGASLDEIRAFSRRLDGRVKHNIFVGDGLDVQASCGQLAAVPRIHPRASIMPRAETQRSAPNARARAM